MTKPRDYKAEYARYQGLPQHIDERSQRNKARRIETKLLGKKALEGKDVDHKKMIVKGGTNAPSNLRPRSVHLNRGWEKKR